MSVEQFDVPLNPADVERWIREVSNRIAKGVGVISAAEREAKARRREFDLAYAHAYKNAGDLPAHMRKYEADIVSMPHREAAENAELAYKHAERTARALEKELMAAQSISASIRSLYSAAGVAG